MSAGHFERRRRERRSWRDSFVPFYLASTSQISEDTQCEDGALRGKKRKREIFVCGVFLIERRDGCTLDDPARLRSLSLLTATFSGKAASEEVAGGCDGMFAVHFAKFC